jgi:phosphatidyl-myo-inositol alpha-mannosyltransferase
MKIGLVCPYNISAGGGVQECVNALYSGLKARGHSVKIITPLPKSSLINKQKDIIFLGAGRKVSSFHTTGQIGVSTDLKSLRAILDYEQFDILHFHEPWIPVLSYQILSNSRAAHIGTFHAMLPETLMTRTIQKIVTPYTKSILKYLDGFTAVSPAAAKYVQTLTHQPITFVPNGIDLKKYKANARHDTSSNIVFIGRLEKRKGVIYLLKAFQELQKYSPNTKLNIIGDGPDRKKLELFVKTQKLRNIHFHGFVDEKTKIKLLSSATIFCSPALYGESFGIVLLEAMALGVPIVAGDNVGYRSVLTGKGSLSLVDPEDVLTFSQRLLLLLNDQEVRTLWRAWARQEIIQYDYRKIVDQYENYYKLMSKKTKSKP